MEEFTAAFLRRVTESQRRWRIGEGEDLFLRGRLQPFAADSGSWLHQKVVSERVFH